MTCATCVMAGRWKVESLEKCRELGESLHCLSVISVISVGHLPLIVGFFIHDTHVGPI